MWSTRWYGVAKIFHQALTMKLNLLDEKVPYCKYYPIRLLQKGSLKMYWDESIITDHTVRHNRRANILIIDLGAKKAKLIDIAIPNHNNISTTVGEKLRKYQELSIELKELYHLERVLVTPIIISTNGLIPKSTVAGTDGLELPLDALREAQQAVLLDTARSSRKVLNI